MPLLFQRLDGWLRQHLVLACVILVSMIVIAFLACPSDSVAFATAAVVPLIATSLLVRLLNEKKCNSFVRIGLVLYAAMWGMSFCLGDWETSNMRRELSRDRIDLSMFCVGSENLDGIYHIQRLQNGEMSFDKSFYLRYIGSPCPFVCIASVGIFNSNGVGSAESYFFCPLMPAWKIAFVYHILD
jgi:hypothetical protein